MVLNRRAFLIGAASAAALAACAGRRRSPEARPGGVAAPPPTTSPAPGAPSSGPSHGGPSRNGPSHGGPSRNGPGSFVRSGPAGADGVALTFHGSGDTTLTGRLLDAAHRVGAPITVFAVGQWLVANPAMAERLLAAGHELANHTYTHPALGTVDRAGVAAEITRCRDVLRSQTGEPGRWFRPSGIETPTPLMVEEAQRAGYATVVGFDVDPLDYRDPGAEAVVARVTGALHPGAIVSLHTGHAGTVAAFEPIVAAVRAAGLEPVLLHDLLGART